MILCNLVTTNCGGLQSQNVNPPKQNQGKMVNMITHPQWVRKHYIPEGGPNISTAKCDTNLRSTPFMYIYISLGSRIVESNLGEQTV